MKPHRQAAELLQETAENKFALNTKLPPLPLLPLLKSKHPPGTPDHELAGTFMYEIPTCPAAASHVGLSVIVWYPCESQVPEVTTGYASKMGELLHWLREA